MIFGIAMQQRKRKKGKLKIKSEKFSDSSRQRPDFRVGLPYFRVLKTTPASRAKICQSRLKNDVLTDFIGYFILINTRSTYRRIEIIRRRDRRGLKLLHKTLKKKREADRVKAIVWLASGLTEKQLVALVTALPNIPIAKQKS
jgi:hypothetical protein